MKYTVYLNGYSCLSVEVEAKNPEEALELAWDKADGSEASFSDWDYFNEVEVEDEDGNYIEVIQ